MTHLSDIIQADFDRLAERSDDTWNHNSHYHSFLLRHVPTPCAQALDIGCGTGHFTRLLAGRADHVLGIDLSPDMIRVASERSAFLSNVRYQVADVMSYDLPAETFDCIVSMATLHHLPLETILVKMKTALKVGGTLLVLDLFQAEGYADMFSSLLAVPTSLMLRLVKCQRLRESRETHAAWAAHSQHDSYLTLRDIRRVCASVLPGSSVKKHLLWRYSIIWHKTGSN